MSDQLPYLVLVRHGQSEWNKKIYLLVGKILLSQNKARMKQSQQVKKNKPPRNKVSFTLHIQSHSSAKDWRTYSERTWSTRLKDRGEYCIKREKLR